MADRQLTQWRWRLFGTAIEIEWPTLLVLIGNYCLWVVVILSHTPGSVWWILLAAPAGAVSAMLHSSLQHEVLHGHPTRQAWLNELLIFPSLVVWLPYRRYKRLHLIHHNDEQLTEPLLDPESWYLSDGKTRFGSLHYRILAFNNTLLGRITVGPWLAMQSFLSAELRLLLQQPRKYGPAWTLHVLGLVPVLYFLAVAQLPLWKYVLCITWPGTSLMLIRSFIEHRAAPSVHQRTAVIEAGPFWSLLFLNNNLHAVHHRHPGLAWYLLPAAWRSDKTGVLHRNNHYYYSGGYAAVFRRWLLRRREPVFHPYGGENLK